MIAKIASIVVLAAMLVSPASTNPHAPDDSTTSTTIRVWGDDAFATTIQALETGYRLRHPDVRFETKLFGSDTGIAGLYTSVADLAVLGRVIRPVETLAYTWVFKRPPVGIPLAIGAVTTPRHSSPLAVLVHADNPISRVTFAQLDALLGVERRRGAERPVTTWGDLGATQGNATRPIHVYLRNVEKGTADALRAKVLAGSRKFRWALIHEFDDRVEASGRLVDADDAILAAVAHDPDGLGVARPSVGNRSVKVLAVAERDAGPFVYPERAALSSGTYPLTRRIMAYVNPARTEGVEAPVDAFLRFLVSAPGQQIIAQADDFLPLDEDSLREATTVLSR